MKTVFDHRKHEREIYRKWESSGVFTPKIDKRKKPFVMIMPPPNANDDLHIGHARFVMIEDILARYYRMKGSPTLWLPGADHAGIETQYVFEKRLAERGKSRFDYDRESLYKMIWDYSHKYKGEMENQLRALGASCDWRRNRFTLDPEIVEIVYGTFKRLYDDGLVYRGEKVVNYCTKCGTSFSQLEVNYVESEGEMYYLDYGTLVIATTRPETIFADVAVAVNPKDKVMKKLIGKKAVIPIIRREVPIIGDWLVDPDFGTGALKVTPGHDALDFEIGQKHKLAVINVIDEEGKMMNTPEKYAGMGVSKAREVVLHDLEQGGYLRKVKAITHTVGKCYRCKSTIEPLISKQWFIKIAPLAKQALLSMKNRKTRFVAKKYEKMARHWLKNLHDWNISRQIVWGVRIPAWRCEKCMDWMITNGKRPKRCGKCGHKKLIQDEDTFDTWFSSGQWPFATLMSTAAGDFEYFYPTSVMETAYDILPFWVLRMMMLGLYATGKVPFEEVLIHGLVRDKMGTKISKSKGNVINPLVMVEKYGSDALRMGIIWGALVENDVSLSENNIRAQRNFANKIWNIARFVITNRESKRMEVLKRRPMAKHEDDKWILDELRQATKKITRALDKRRLNEGAEELYGFIWKKLADVYLESVKKGEGTQKVLEYVFEESLKLAHPFMPFVTESIWQEAFGDDSGFLIYASWPRA